MKTKSSATGSWQARIVPWIPAWVAAGVVIASVSSYSRQSEIHAGPGSPYYDKAVREALQGLVNLGGGAQAPAADVPPPPPGSNPDEVYWCEQCKTYHRRQPGIPGPDAQQPVVPLQEPEIPPPPGVPPLMLTPLPEAPAE